MLTIKKARLSNNIKRMMLEQAREDGEVEILPFEPFFPFHKDYDYDFESTTPLTYKGVALHSIDIISSFSNQPSPLDFALPGLLRGTVGSLVCAGGGGKSMLALQLAVSVALGGQSPISEHPLKQGKCLFLAGEDVSQVISSRLYSLCMQMKYTKEQQNTIAENLQIINLPESGVNMDINEHICPQFIGNIAKGYRVIIIDTLRRFHISEENSSGEMAILISNLEKIAHKTGASVMFLHHTNKSAAYNGGTDSQQASRGSSVLVDNIRWQAFLSPMSREESEKFTDIQPGALAIGNDDRRLFVRYGVSKQNYGSPLPEIWLRREEGGILIPVKLFNAKKHKKSDDGIGV